MKTVLITAIGSFSSDIAIKTCREILGFRVIGCDIYPYEWVAQSQDVDAFYQAPLASEADAYVDFIRKLIREEKIDFILPSTDVEVDVLSDNRKAISESGAVLCISGPKTIEICRNKKLFAEKVGALIGASDSVCRVIPTSLVCDENTPAFPVIVKPVNGRSSQGLRKIENADEYKLVDKSYLVQPYIDGMVITVDVVRHPGSRYVETLPRIEYLRTPSGAGTSIKIFRDSDLEALCKDIAEGLGIIGCVCFEFILDKDGRYHILECNPRLSGGVAFSCYAGYNFVKAHFDCFTEDDIDIKEDIPEQYFARKYIEVQM